MQGSDREGPDRRSPPRTEDRRRAIGDANATRRAILGAVATAAIGALGPTPARGQAPGGPSRFLVNGAPGSVGDLLARPVAEALARASGAPVVVENRPGAGSIASISELMKSPADGQAVIMISAAQVVWNKYLYTKLPYDPDTDLVPVSPMAAIPMMLAVHPDSVPAKSVQEFVALAKSSPGRYTYGFGGAGNVAHISFERFRGVAGIDMVPVTYKSGPGALQDLIGGQIHAMLDGVSLLEPHVRSGRLRALAVATRARLPSMPDVPTIAESGYPGFEAVVWVGAAVRRGTPADAVERLNAAIGAALQTRGVQDAYARLGAEVRTSSQKAFADFVREEDRVWAPVIRQANVRLD